MRELIADKTDLIAVMVIILSLLVIFFQIAISAMSQG